MTLLRRLLEQPIGNDDRRTAFAVAAAALALAATLLTLAAGPADRATTEPASRLTAPRAERPAVRADPDAPPAEARQVARRFLSGYLAHLHGHARPSEIRGATHRLRRRLATRAVRVSPAMRRQRLRVERIDGHRHGHGWLIHAEIAAATVSFPVSIVVVDRPRGPVVTRVVED